MTDNIGFSLLTPTRETTGVSIARPQNDEDAQKKPKAQFVNSIFDGNAGAYTS